MQRIDLGIWKAGFGSPDTFTPVHTMKRHLSVRNGALERLPQDECPLSIEEIVYKATGRGVLLELPLSSSEQLYGFGLQLQSFAQRGKKKVMRTNSDPIADTGDSHAPVPFFVSSKGYGVLVDTARYAAFYCGSHRKAAREQASREGTPDLTERVIEADSPAAEGGTPEQLYAMRVRAESDKMISIEIPLAAGIDVYIFAGPTMKLAVQRYNLFSGGGCLPAIWGLGVWYRAYGKASQEDVLRIGSELRQADMPCDVIGLEPGWQSRAYSCSFVWDKHRFPDPKTLIAGLQAAHFKINLWEHVFTHPTSPMYNRLLPLSGDQEVWDGLVPDLYLQETREVFGGYHGSELVDQGIAGFKCDECDNSDYIRTPWSFPEHTQFPSGMDGEQMHNLIGLLYQQTLLEPYRARDKRTYGQVRASHALASSLPYVLYSDLYDHRQFIRGVVNMGFCGLLWSPEVRQCDSAADLIRRLQTVVCSPQAIVNAWMIPHPPWFQYDYELNLGHIPMENAEETMSICREWLRLRMALLPYLYTSFDRYRSEGIPPFRALVLDYPDDPRVYDIDYAYMMGPSLLVAPLTAGQSEIDIYLPSGGWRCFWSGRYYAGGQSYKLCFGLERIPIFVRNNTLLPLAEPVAYVSDETIFDITVYAYGDEPEDSYLYEDDGTTYQYENGDYNHIELKWENREASSSRQACSRKLYDIIEWKRV